MTTTNKNLNQPSANSTNWNVPLNENFGYIDAALGGNTVKNVTGVGTTPVVLTTAEYQNMILTFSGALSNNVEYRIPSGVGGHWIIRNGTSGDYTVTISSGRGGGTTFVAPQGFARSVYSDGSNIRSTNELDGNVITGRNEPNTPAQSIGYTGIITAFDNDGVKSSGSYTPAPEGGNMKTITNSGPFSFLSPTAAGDYTIIIQITNITGAGSIIFTNFTAVTGDAINNNVGDKFFAYITKCNGFTHLHLVALQ